MATVGDLVAYLSMDNSRFQQGAAQAQAAARQTGSVISGALNPRLLQQGGFALQDFFSVLNQGGANAAARAFGGITNNLAMLGAGFGPVGMAVTSLGAGIATVLIPQLMKGTEESHQFADAMERIGHAVDQEIAAMERQAQMRQKLADLTRDTDFDGKREQGIKREAERAERELESIQKQIQLKNDAFRLNMNTANRAAQEAGDTPAVIGGVNAFDRSGRLKEGATLNVSDKYFETFTKQRDAIVDLYQKERELKEFRKQLREAQPGARERDQEEEANKRERQHFEEQIARRNQINEQAMSQHEKTKQRLREIADLEKGGFLLPYEARAAARKAIMELPTARGSQEALVAGSSGAISAINKAQAGDDQWKQQIKLAQALLDEAKQQNQVLKEIAKDGRMEAVTIGP